MSMYLCIYYTFNKRFLIYYYGDYCDLRQMSWVIHYICEIWIKNKFVLNQYKWINYWAAVLC